jgi:DNA-binding response OmpR family regulator
MSEVKVVHRVLLIDDDRKLARLLTDYLRTQSYEVSVAHDGADGLLQARKEPCDLIILDVMLPRIDGFEVLRQLREFSQIPVLMLTGRGAEDDLVAGLDQGADDYLPKTASARELLARIQALLRRAAVKASERQRQSPEPQAEVRVGALRLSPASRGAWVDDVALNLTGVEFDLLATLMRHKGHVLSREQLSQDVHERRFEAFDRSIDVHIASLRKKLGDDLRAARFIRTVRGAGYQLLDPGPVPR